MTQKLPAADFQYDSIFCSDTYRPGAESIPAVFRQLFCHFLILDKPPVFIDEKRTNCHNDDNENTKGEEK